MFVLDLLSLVLFLVLEPEARRCREPLVRVSGTKRLLLREVGEW